MYALHPDVSADQSLTAPTHCCSTCAFVPDRRIYMHPSIATGNRLGSTLAVVVSVYNVQTGTIIVSSPVFFVFGAMVGYGVGEWVSCRV